MMDLSRTDCANSVLLVDDEDDVREALRQTLELEGFEVQEAADGETALAQVTQLWPGIVLSDVRMPRMNGLKLFETMQEIDADIPVILITAHGDIPMAVTAMQGGAYSFIEKPAEPDALIDTVRRAMEKRRLVLENRRLRDQLNRNDAIENRLIGISPQIRKLREMAVMLAEADTDVLVIGETGTGKELVARCLHDFGPRKKERFVALNCGGLPETIVESELFGHEKGAFTGAQNRRIGKIEHAGGGTLFLDEIESMPPAVQAKLLRVLQERSFERLGSNTTIKVDIRVVAAAKSDLSAQLDDGSFRQDLFFRLNVAPLKIPPLRERQEDVPVLFSHFLELAAIHRGRPVPELPRSAIAKLSSCDWMGNVRELKNLAERYVIGLPLFENTETSGDKHDGKGPMTLKAQLAVFEKSVIANALDLHDGRVDHTARYLDLPRKTLYLKMRKHGLSRLDFK